MKRFVIIPPDWRAPYFRDLMSTIDHAHDLMRVLNVKNDARGQHVRRRDEDSLDRISTRRPAPRRLPINFYDPKWLKNQGEIWIKDILQPQEKMEVPFGKDAAM